jgi:nicotinate-nucleotide pyrophosphorylase (carboxylating)
MSPKRSFSDVQWTPELDRQIRAALREDAGKGDMTSLATVPPRLMGWGRLIAKADGVLCGTHVADRVWRLADKKIEVAWRVHDGLDVTPGTVLATLKGRLRGLLLGERVALNFLQRLSGIATLTACFHDAVGGADGPVICDTRKTTPLWRALERYAVRVGGGINHRFGLFDMILIKENHARAAGGLREAIVLAKASRGRLRIAAEARTPREVQICCEERVDLVLLDNFTPQHARSVIARFRPASIPFEVSGGVTLRNAKSFARSGCDRISIGALTHSAPAMDISLQLYRHDQNADEQ